MLTYYPPLTPYKEHRLAVDAPHQLYIEECGNPQGVPILVVHGGPGAGCSEDNRRYFDPEHYRIILVDQRGAGRSTPYASLEGNNTQALVGDMERIRQFLGIDRWILFGGSWGATLSLVYAETHPKAIAGLILRGVFLARAEDITWVQAKNGARRIFPDYWEEWVEPLAESQRNDAIVAYQELLNHDDELSSLAAAKRYVTWEARCATLTLNQTIINDFTQPQRALGFARIEAHYLANGCFLGDNQILKNIANIQHLPAIIVHGRYDMVCPLDNAWDLHKVWPSSELWIVPAAGHLSAEPGIIDGLVHATRKMATLSNVR